MIFYHFFFADCEGLSIFAFDLHNSPFLHKQIDTL